MLKLLIIFNPNAGSGRSQKYLPLITSHLEHHQINFDLLTTTHSGHAKELIETADLSQYSGLIAAGGDGTLFELVNGLMQHEAAARIPLGVIPVGTGNAFARELGLMPTDWQKGIEIILQQQTKHIDIGMAQDKHHAMYFINILGMGFVVNAGQTTTKIKKLGKSAYTFATLWETIKLKKYPMAISMVDSNNQTIEMADELVFVEVANSRYTGTSFLIAPDAKIDDGLLDVIILKQISRAKILRLFPTIYSGQHINYSEVKTFQVKSITIKTKQPMPLMPDGEFNGETPVKIMCLPAQIQFFS
ncbi:diacylglycerol kinase family lipid kinase [Marinicella sp. S1101]|uniref:diacylglycerol/lipid kinase family protein n=1 Tax=Marinicella marina TaxID=2996016 RepID=UPI00226090CF|nr:diacylglycerol kinase family protein [Marinicella marina]MCX7554979.1 diacylglycerol kinase family lipid kinase [Marinicella marina]MDJ1141589.1 diacylglycerol kinase family lipid kinase [Marinicella marina]